MGEEQKDVQEKYRERLAATLKAQRSMGQKGPFWDNYALGRNVLHEDLDPESERHQFPYELDTDTRDILIAHARQDAAHTLANTASLLNAIRTLKWLTLIVAALLLAVALRLWHLI